MASYEYDKTLVAPRVAAKYNAILLKYQTNSLFMYFVRLNYNVFSIVHLRHFTFFLCKGAIRFELTKSYDNFISILLLSFNFNF